MDPLRLIELAAAALILGAGVFLYRRQPAAGEDDGGGYGSQGAVLLFVLALIVAIHGSGALDYRPTASELEMAKGLARMSRQ